MESTKSEKIVESRKKYIEGQSALHAGTSGPLVFQNAILHKKMASFKRNRIAEQEVMPPNSVVFGNFRLTNAISEYTKAKLFNGEEEDIKIAVSFSEVTGDSIDSYLERNPIEFSIRFYSKDGEWNLAGKSVPVARENDSEMFSDLIRKQQIKTTTNFGTPTIFWDFMSLNPASLHHLLMVMSDRGTPVGYCHMNGYGVRTFTLVNAKNEKFFVKFHLKTVQGIRSFTGEEASEKHRENKSFARRALTETISESDFPKWSLKIQVMPAEQVNNNYYNPFDLTKTWSQKNFPLIDVGEIELNEIPKNQTTEFEKSDVEPIHEIDGISISVYDEPGGLDNSKEDHYTQSQELFIRAMNSYNRDNLISNIVDSMRKIKGDQRIAIINRQLSHFFRVDVELGVRVAKGLNVDVEDVLNELIKTERELV